MYCILMVYFWLILSDSTFGFLFALIFDGENIKSVTIKLQRNLHNICLFTIVNKHRRYFNLLILVVFLNKLYFLM